MLQYYVYKRKCFLLIFIFSIHYGIPPFGSCLLETVEDGARNKPLNMKDTIIGLVLARCGSKGIPLKNLAIIRNESLLRRTLRTLHAFGRFNAVWVSTDCIEIQLEALSAGALVHQRSAKSATDSAPSLIAVQEFVNENPDVEVVGLFQCTSPFLSVPFIHSAFSLLTKGYDSVFSVSREHKLRWELLSDGQAKPVNFDPLHRPRRQDWDGDIVENGMFYFSRAKYIKKGLLQGGRFVLPLCCRLLSFENSFLKHKL